MSRFGVRRRILCSCVTGSARLVHSDRQLHDTRSLDVALAHSDRCA
jgi:hypothetical protein